MMHKSWGIHTFAFGLLIIGGLNWGLALWNIDIAHWGLPMMLVKIIYVLVALAALYEAFTHGMRCRECKPEGAMHS